MMFQDFNSNEVSLNHSSNAETRTFWLRIRGKKENEATAELTVPDARLLIAMLRKAIEEAGD